MSWSRWGSTSRFRTFCCKGRGVKLSQRIRKCRAVKTYGQVEVYLHALLTPALDGGE
jgi:hypothetical protein